MSADITPEELEKQTKKIIKKQKEAPKLQVKSTGQIRFKDKPGRGGIQLNFIESFGFFPEVLIIQKVQGKNNTIVVSAVIPEKILKEEKKK